jgi:hypothetical protein
MSKRCTSSALFHEPLAKKHSMYNCLVVMQEQRSVYNNTGHRIEGVFRPLLSLQFRKTNIPGVLVLMLAGIAIDLALGIIGRLCTDSLSSASEMPIGVANSTTFERQFRQPDTGRIMSVHIRSGLSIRTQLRGISQK